MMIQNVPFMFNNLSITGPHPTMNIPKTEDELNIEPGLTSRHYGYYGGYLASQIVKTSSKKSCGK